MTSHLVGWDDRTTDQSAEVTVFEAEKKASVEVDISSLPPEERIGLLFYGGMSIRNIADHEECRSIQVEHALRSVVKALSDQNYDLRASIQKTSDQLYAEYEAAAHRDHIEDEMNEVRTYRDGFADAYAYAAQDVLDILNFRKRGKSTFNKPSVWTLIKLRATAWKKSAARTALRNS